MLTVAIVATLAGGGSAAATWGSGPGEAGGTSEIAAETAITPVLELPNGCAGDDWSFEGAID